MPANWCQREGLSLRTPDYKTGALHLSYVGDRGGGATSPAFKCFSPTPRYVVLGAGLEPAACRLRSGCTAIVLPQHDLGPAETSPREPARPTGQGEPYAQGLQSW